MQLQIKLGYQLRVANTPLLCLISKIQLMYIIITLKIKFKMQMIKNKTKDQVITLIKIANFALQKNIANTVLGGDH